jgi:ATPase family associated with various cellular activities (AAA)
MANHQDEPEVATPKASQGSALTKADEDQAYYHWSKRNGLFRPVGHTQDQVPAGIYEIDNDNSGWYLSKVKFPSDFLLRLPGTPTDYILDQIDVFWKREELFKQTGLLHKRGILMYGPAGCGKTSIIRLLCDDVVKKRDGLVIMVTNCRLAETALGGIRQIEPRRPILTIIEDIETFMGNSDESSSARALLALLDGETQIDHVVHLATTNKPELLEDRVVKRPGRFDLVIGLNHPVENARREYLNKFHMDLSQEELEFMVKETEGLGLAHLRELVAASYCLGQDRKETLARLKSNFKKKLKSGGKDNVMGFTTTFLDDAGNIKLNE